MIFSKLILSSFFSFLLCLFLFICILFLEDSNLFSYSKSQGKSDIILFRKGYLLNFSHIKPGPYSNRGWISNRSPRPSFSKQLLTGEGVKGKRSTLSTKWHNHDLKLCQQHYVMLSHSWSFVSKNKQHTAVTNMARHCMLEKAFILNIWRVVCLNIHLQKWPSARLQLILNVN